MKFEIELNEKAVKTIAAIGAILFIALAARVFISGDMGYMLAW